MAGWQQDPRRQPPQDQWPPRQQVEPYRGQWPPPQHVSLPDARPWPPQQPQQPHAPQQWQHPVTVAPKSPAVGLLCGLLLPGLGCMVNGRAGLGIAILACWLVSLLLVLALVGWILAPACWIWSMVAGYKTAQSWNREHGILS